MRFYTERWPIFSVLDSCSSTEKRCAPKRDCLNASNFFPTGSEKEGN